MTSGHFKVATIWRDDGEQRVLSVTDEGADNQKSADSSEEDAIKIGPKHLVPDYGS